MRENVIVNVVLVPAKTRAAASVCSAIYHLVAIGQLDAARYLFNGLADELRTEVHRVMDADLPRRVVDAVNAGRLSPDEVFVDETTMPASIVIVERTEPQAKPRQEPLWDQLVETALLEVLGDRDLVTKITRNADSYRDLARQVRARAEEDDVDAVEILRRLGPVKLDAATHHYDPVQYLITEVHDWTTSTDPNTW